MNSQALFRISIVSLAAWLPGFSPVGRGQEPAIPPKPPVIDEIYPLTISPRPAPVPGFRYRLLPLDSDRTPGDAAPIYLRLSHEIAADRLKTLSEKPYEWTHLPLDQFPLSEARALVDSFQSRLRQLEYGTRRQTCNWNYTLPEERDHAFEILLPDVQQMRSWARLVALKARVEMAEGKLDESIRTIETGLAFSVHIAEGPFLINSLVGMAVARVMLERVDELISRPDAPNLYWALTALPRPLIGIRKSFDIELKMLDWTFPELGEVTQQKTPAEWTSLLDRFHKRFAAVLKKSELIDAATRPKVIFEVDPARFRSTLLPEARQYFKASGHSVEGWSDDQTLMLFIEGRLREIHDEWSEPFYLPFAEATPIHQAISKRTEVDKVGPLGFLVALLPAAESCQAAEARLDRKLAALRAVEAIRMQAASDGGKFLVESLKQITVVPVPIDPSNGHPFNLNRKGETFSLISGPIYNARLIYQVTPRK